MTDYSSEDFWKGAPEGATHYFAPFFYKVEELRMYLFETSWEPSAYSSRQMDRLGVKRPQINQPWSGDGPPPVGTHCELRISGDNWQPCEVIAMDEQYGNPVSVVRYGVGYYGADLSCLRPARTPAQIAAEERESAIDEMPDGGVAMIVGWKVNALVAHIADLKQQLAAASITAENCETFRRNAERYLFLRNLHYDLMGSAGIPCAAIPSSSMSGVFVNGYDLDAAIDAARDIAAMDIGSGD